MYNTLRYLLFFLPPEMAHSFTLFGLKTLYVLNLSGLLTNNPADNPIEVFGLRFKNHIGIAAGMDKNGDYINALAATLKPGFIEVGGVTPQFQAGNLFPRLFRLPTVEAIINRMGFNNKGVDHLVENLKQRKTDCVVGVNIGKNEDTPLERAADDYEHCLRKVYADADYVTMNVSCPNVRGGLQLQCTDYLKGLLTSVMAERDRLLKEHNKYTPLLMKISPDLSEGEVVDIARIAEDLKVDGIIATNTTTRRDGVQGVPFGDEAGGLSGKPLAQDSLRVLRLLKRCCVTMPIISVGGISTQLDVQERLKMGASLVQIYTALVYGGPKVIEDLTRYTTIPHSSD